MRTFIYVMIIVGYLGIGFVYAYTTWRLYVYNEISSNAFKFAQTSGLITTVTKAENEVLVVDYTYTVVNANYKCQLPRKCTIEK